MRVPDNGTLIFLQEENVWTTENGSKKHSLV